MSTRNAPILTTLEARAREIVTVEKWSGSKDGDDARWSIWFHGVEMPGTDHPAREVGEWTAGIERMRLVAAWRGPSIEHAAPASAETCPTCGRRADDDAPSPCSNSFHLAARRPAARPSTPGDGHSIGPLALTDDEHRRVVETLDRRGVGEAGWERAYRRERDAVLSGRPPSPSPADLGGATWEPGEGGAECLWLNRKAIGNAFPNGNWTALNTSGRAPDGTLESARLAAVSELRRAGVLPRTDATPAQGSDGRPMLTEWRDDEVIVGGFGREIVDGNRNAGLLVFPADDGSERWTWRVYSHDGPSRGRHQIVADGFEPDPDSAKRAADNCDARKRLYRLPASPAPKPDPAGGDATIEGKPDHDCPHPYGRVFVSLTDGDGWALDGFSGPIVACPFCGARLAAPDSPTAANAPAPRTDAPIATIDLITAYAEHASNDCDGNCGFEDEDGKPKPDPACPEGVRLAAAVTASPTDAERSERFPGSVGARATGDGLRKALRRLRREPVECDRGNSSAFTDYGYRCVECSAEAADVESIEHAEDCRLIIIDRALAAAPVGGAREEKEPTKCDECGFLVGDGFECDHFIDGRDRAVAGKGTP